MVTNLPCPECGAHLEIVSDGRVGVAYAAGSARVDRPTEYRPVARPFGACPHCEFCIEIDVRVK